MTKLPLAANDSSPTEARAASGLSEQMRRELADFLRTRREKLKPDQVGLAQTGRRRTPGLRREEVAELAGVGTTWYTWLEQARDIQPSAEVLRRLATALQLNAAEIRHMFTLVGKSAPSEIASNEVPSDALIRTLNEAFQVPALLLGARWDVLAANTVALTEMPGIRDIVANKGNWVRHVYSHPIRDRLSSWEANARRLLAEFRSSISDLIDNPWVIELVESLRAESPEFAKWWLEHDVRDNSPVVYEIIVDGVKKTRERTVLGAMDNSRFKIILFNPVKSTPAS